MRLAACSRVFNQAVWPACTLVYNKRCRVAACTPQQAVPCGLPNSGVQQNGPLGNEGTSPRAPTCCLQRHWVPSSASLLSVDVLATKRQRSETSDWWHDHTFTLATHLDTLCDDWAPSNLFCLPSTGHASNARLLRMSDDCRPTTHEDDEEMKNTSHRELPTSTEREADHAQHRPQTDPHFTTKPERVSLWLSSKDTASHTAIIAIRHFQHHGSCH